MRKYKVVLVFIVLFFGIQLFGQDVTLSVSAPQNVVAGQTFKLVYTANAQVDGFAPPNFGEFNVLRGPDRGSSFSSSYVNGRMEQSTQISFTYYLSCSKTGKFTIPAATVQHKRKTVSSKAITINVSKTAAASGGNSTVNKSNTSNVFLRIIVNKTNAYVGEQILGSIKLYTKVDISELSDYKYPSYSGFYKEDIKTAPLRNLTPETINGEQFYTGIISQFLITPQRAGELEIEPMTLVAMTRRRINNPRSFFQQYENLPVTAASIPVKIKVNALPAGKPASFGGGVGQFTMTANLDKTETTTNEPVKLTLQISGTGNIKLIDKPKISFPADVEVYDPDVKTNVNVSALGSSGTITYEYLLIPRYSGDFVIPPIQNAYFNTKTKKYQEIFSPEFELKVNKGENEESPTAFGYQNNQQEIKILADDIKFIKKDEAGLIKRSSLVLNKKFYYLYLIILLVLLGLFLITRKRIIESRDLVNERIKKARKSAKKRLKKAQVALKEQNNSLFYDEILKALWGYLSDKLAIDKAKLSKDKVVDVLKSYNVDEELINKTVTLIDKCEYAKFAPLNTESQLIDDISQVEDIITQLEQNKY